LIRRLLIRQLLIRRVLARSSARSQFCQMALEYLRVPLPRLGL